MVARTSTLTNAFVSALIPRVEPTADEIDEALLILALDPDDLRCSYCGQKYNTWDHLRPLVTGRKPTGFISEIANLVPACNPCNSSKGGSYWKDWMFGKASGSPASRRIPDVEARAVRLHAYESWREPIKLDFAAILGEIAWNDYWALCDRAVSDLRAAQDVANELKARIDAAVATMQ
jgi:hypothetical protein